jgi:HlyD family secretion protein
MAMTRPLGETPLVVPPGLLGGSRRARTWAVVAFLALASTFGLLARRRAARSVAAPLYRTEAVVVRSIVQQVEAPAQLDVPARTEVAAPSPGLLVEVLVRPGDVVARGARLARLDPRAAGFELEGARAAERAAEARVDEAEAAHRAAADVKGRAERHFGLDPSQRWRATAAEASEARSLGALRAARAELAAAAGRREAAELSRRERTLRAPAAGVVLAAPERTGGVVGPATGALFVLGSTLDEFVVRASVAEADVGQVRVGQRAEFAVPAFPDRTFEARVDAVQIEPEARPGAVTYPVLLAASNPGRALFPKMTATVRIEVARAEGALAVREAALRFLPEGAAPAPPRSRLWLSGDGTHVEARFVSAGVTDGVFTEVRPGGREVRPGDRAVVGLLPRAEGDGGPGITLGARR